MFSKIRQIQTAALFGGKASMFSTFQVLKKMAVKSGRRLDGRSHKWSQYV